ncbi:hypothetical protein Tco_0941556 [Tanacetum coccineum]|uniref:Uncharacterized protein n=1 Tax=Tanacetum coccineum TaxID=301880 RepID=A0ABQ5DR85_9ASTR
MKFSTLEDETCLSIDMVDVAVLDNVQEILPSYPMGSFLFESVLNYQQCGVDNLWEDKSNEHDQEESSTIESPCDKDGWEPKPTLFAASTSETEIQIPNLKELPSHLEYAFLDDNK